MKTNKTTHPVHQTRPARLPRYEPKQEQRRPEPQDGAEYPRQNDFFALCFYPGMKAVALPLTSYPTAV